MRKLLVALLAVPAVLFLLLLLAFSFLVLSLAPPIVTWVAVGVLVVVAVWFFFARGRSASDPASEGALMGRQNSKDGLL